MKKLPLILITILFVLIGIAAYTFNQGTFSKEAVRLEIIAANEVDCGQESEYIIKFKNNGNANLENIRLNIEFPESSIVSDYDGVMIIKDSDEIGIVYPGQEKIYRIKARMFGSESDTININTDLTYSPKGLSARYSSKTQLPVRIKEVPINLEFDSPSRVETGKDIELSLNYFSNIEYPLSDLMIEIMYPEGFKFRSSSPRALDKNNWRIESLNDKNGGKININGTLYGQAGDTKVFEAKLGFYMNGRFIELVKTEFSITMKESAIEINQTINGDSRYTANLGETLNYNIEFTNTGSHTLKDLFLAVKLRGDIYDYDTISAVGVEVKEGDKNIIWEADDSSDLKVLASGETGRVSFSIKTKERYNENEFNPVLINKIIISEIQHEFETKLNSNIRLKQILMHEDEVFQSKGPVPLEVGKQSILTVIWSISNYFNDLENVKIKAELPENVSVTGEIGPKESADNFTFDSESRELLWSIGNLPKGIGTGSKIKVLQLQISITPDSSDRGNHADIIKNIKIFGEDMWTQESIEYRYNNLTSESIVGEDDLLVK